MDDVEEPSYYLSNGGVPYTPNSQSAPCYKT